MAKRPPEEKPFTAAQADSEAYECEGCDQEIEYGFANPHGNRKQRRAYAALQRRKK